METHLEPVKKYGWFRKLKTIFVEKYVYDGPKSRFATGSLIFLSSLAMLAAARGIPTGLGILFDFTASIAANLLALSICLPLISFVLALLHLPLPRRASAAVLYVTIQFYIIFDFAELGHIMSIVLAVLTVFITLFIGVVLAFISYSRVGRIRKLIYAIVLALSLVVTQKLFYEYGPSSAPQRDMQFDEGYSIPDGILQEVSLADPSQSGPLHYKKLHYSSGRDKHRSWFGEASELYSQTVDASKYITYWPKLKTKFWGFDQTQLPVNGTMWLPEGEGPFPVVLIVHGNHLMEYFSDGGYDYLGELLASKGMAVISVDENFLNYSVWSSIPNDDMRMRAWMLLQHARQLGQWNEEQNHVLEGKLDMHNLAIVGHSRGGQAAAMAADSERWFADDGLLPNKESYTINAVVALAPTDKWIDSEATNLSTVSYLTLQGARDADVNTFFGERQYTRTSLEREGLFKAALYIADANHSQFNSQWGIFDERLPAGLFLNRKGMLSSAQQKHIAKVYTAAFLEATLQNKTEYKLVFQDYRYALSWLPATQYISRYEESGFIAVNPADDKDIVAEADGMSGFDETYAKDRDGQSKEVKGFELEWEEAGASFEVLPSELSLQQLDSLLEASFVFSLANLEHELHDSQQYEVEEASGSTDHIQKEDEELLGSSGSNVSDDSAAEQGFPDEKANRSNPEVQIEIETDNDMRLVLQLDDFMPIAPPVYTTFTNIAWLENKMKNEKYKNAAEAVFQTFVIPMQNFNPVISSDEDYNLANINGIKRISFRFLNARGKIMIADIGFLSKEESSEQTEDESRE